MPGEAVGREALHLIGNERPTDRSRERDEQYLVVNALGRLGQPSDIAAAVAFLVGPAAAYVTGETLHVNGGMYMP